MKIEKFALPVGYILLGWLIGYSLSQFSFFKINTEINVVETIIAGISILIGLYIAVSIQRRVNRNQNLYNYLVVRLDEIWKDFSTFRKQIEVADLIELSRVTSFVNEFQNKNADFNRLLTELGTINNDLETLSDSLQNVFESSLIKNNIVYYDSKKEQIMAINKQINDRLISIFRQLNRNT
jgi:hypothetical protein